MQGTTRSLKTLGGQTMFQTYFSLLGKFQFGAFAGCYTWILIHLHVFVDFDSFQSYEPTEYAVSSGFLYCEDTLHLLTLTFSLHSTLSLGSVKRLIYNNDVCQIVQPTSSWS